MTRPSGPALLLAAVLGAAPAVTAQAQKPPEKPARHVLSSVEMLMIAAEANRIDVALHLLNKGVDVNARGKNGYTALIVAAGKGSLDVIELLLARKADVDLPNDEGWTPLMEALLRAQDQVAARLLRAGAAVDAREAREGLTALMVAAKGDKPELVAALLAKGADANAADSKRGLTALHLALASTQTKSVEIAAELLVNGGGAGKAASDGFTPLMAAVKSRELPKVTLMLSEKPDPNAAAKDGNSALTLAARGGDPRIVQRLLAAGAKVPAAEAPVTPLAEAVRGGSHEIVALLLDKGADPNRAPADGKTPLILAARAGNHEFVRLLLDRGAAANGRDPKDGTTALMWAANNGRKEIVETLLARGADPRLTANDGWTAGEAARMAGHEDILRMLEEKL